jgi:Carboxypeptidase regulatory-like domain
MMTFFAQKCTLRTLAAGLLTSLLVACGGGGGGGSPVAPAANVTAVSGTVRDSAGAPLAGASVSAAGGNVTTSSDGSYKLEIAAADSTVVLVKKTGFTTTAKEVPVVKDRTTQIDIKLFADQVSTTFSAATSTTIAVNGAKVQIPANALKFSDGGDYTGTVSIGASYYSPDTAQGVQAFAGPYMGVDAGVQSSIVSMGFMEVKLTDATGRPLQLKIGSPATLTYPASSNSAGTATVPLWFYDEAAKIWKREGQATRQSDGTYQGSVTHFTLWNADFFGISATIKGCFRNAAGQPVTDVGALGLRGTGYEHVLRLVSGDTSGNITINLVPANMSLELYSAITPSSFASVAIPALAPGEVRQLSCITATAVPSAAPYVVTAPATLFTTTVSTTPTTPPAGTASFAGNYTGTYGGAETGTFTVSVSSAGVVSGTNFSQTFGQSFTVSGQVTGNGSVSLAASGRAGSAQFSGAISPAGVISGNWNYVAPATGGGTFTGLRTP